MANYFEMAANNSTMMTEIVNAMRDSASDAGATFADDAVQFVKLASQNTNLKEALRNRLAQLAVGYGAEFTSEAATAEAVAVEKLTTLKAAVQGNSKAVSKSSSTETSLGTPVLLLFIAAVLLYAPSVFSTASSALFGDSDAATGNYLS